MIYTLARQLVREGRNAEAMEWLQRLDDLGWNEHIEPDDFPSISQSPGYIELAERISSRAPVVDRAKVMAEVEHPNLLPEGTAWDPIRREVLLSSLHLRKVIAVDAQGRVREVTTHGQDGLLSVLGMEVDTHDRLWVASTAAPSMRGYAPEHAGAAAIYAFDLETGETIGQWSADRQPALLNDLAVSRAGSVYATDTMNGHVLRLDPEIGTWTLLCEDLLDPNGIALSGSEDAVFVADLLGLTRIELATGESERLPNPSEVQSLGGIDGLAYTSGGFVAVQNLAGLGRILWIELDASERRIEHVELLEAGNSSFENPTTGAVAGDAFVFLANPFLQLSPTRELEPHRAGETHTLLRMPLPWVREQAGETPASLFLQELRAASDAWWHLWLPPETADLDLAARLEGGAIGFGYFGEEARRIDDLDEWKRRMRAWLDTLEGLEYASLGREFEVIGETGLEWGHYHEKQILKGGEVRRDHRGRYTMTWVRTPEGWRIAAYHRSAEPPER